MKKLMILLLGFIALFQPIKSVAADWPGTGVCAGTLQACIDAQSVGGSISVATNSEILGNTFIITKGLNLYAKIGFHPVFHTANIIVDAKNSEKITIKGFDFIGASFISGSSEAGSEVNILSNTWHSPDSTLNKKEGIILQGHAAITTDTTTINIKGNTIIGDGLNNNKGFIDVSSFGDGLTRSNIIDNHVTVLIQNFTASDFTPAVYLHKVQNGRMDLQVVGNQIRGGDSQIFLHNGFVASTGQVRIGIVSNILTGVIDEKSSVPSGVPHSAIKFNVGNGNITATIGNNTIDGVKRTTTSDGMGFDMQNLTTVGTVSLSILNNIIVNLSKAYVGPATGTATTVISKSNNFFRDVDSFAGGLFLTFDDVMIDPQFVKEGINYALKDSSPAIDRVDIFGTSLFYDTGFLMGSPKIDADGLRRYKGPKVDSGAIEWGDRHILHQATSNFMNVSTFSDAALNVDVNAIPIITAVWNYENLPGYYNNHPIGVYRASGLWGIINEDVVDLPSNVKFHVFYPYGQDFGGSNLNGLIRWTNPTSGAIGFELDDPILLNNNTGAGIFVSNFWDGNNSPVYNPHSLEVGYKFTTNKWFLANSDGVNMPTSAKIFTYNQDYSRNVFNHRVTVGNTQGPVTIIDHPLLNGNPCALPTVTQVAPFVLFGPSFGTNSHHVGVFYNTPIAKWEIFNQDLVAFDTSALGATSFNVMVDPQQVYECNTKILFSDSFE